MKLIKLEATLTLKLSAVLAPFLEWPSSLANARSSRALEKPYTPKQNGLLMDDINA